MKYYCTIVIGWLLTVCIPVDAARHFKVPRLEKVVCALGVMDSIRTDTVSYTYYFNNNQQKLKVRQGKRGYVEHIGIPLFSQEYEDAYPSPVFDCLEFQTLCRLNHLQENELPLSDIKFFKGSWDILCNIGDQKSVSLETVNEKYYLIKWLENNKVIVELALPINYELLNCMSRKELYDDFVRKLKDSESDYAKPIDYLQAQQSYYIIPEISQKQNIDSLGRLVYDSSLPQESLANLMLASNQVAPSATIQLELVLDQDKREQLQLPLHRWNSLCRSFGCKPYFGYEDSENGIIRGVQVMSNIPTGYDHILYVECLRDNLGKKDVSLKATAYLYVPSSNVKELFASPKKQQSKTKRQNKI